jgi:hypothetical protein
MEEVVQQPCYESTRGKITTRSREREEGEREIFPEEIGSKSYQFQSGERSAIIWWILASNAANTPRVYGLRTCSLVVSGLNHRIQGISITIPLSPYKLSSTRMAGDLEKLQVSNAHRKSLRERTRVLQEHSKTLEDELVYLVKNAPNRLPT